MSEHFFTVTSFRRLRGAGMELGTGIFLSAVFLGTVALFIATKDRWNWKKLLLWPLTIVLGLSVIGGAGFYINSRIQDRPQKELGFWGIQLGASPADVKFAKGEPFHQEDADTWFYRIGAIEDGFDYVIKFKDGKVRYIMYAGDSNFLGSIQGISRSASFEQLIEKFGQPSYVSRSKDELERCVSFEKFNMAFDLAPNFYPVLSSLRRLIMPCWACDAMAMGA